MTVAVVAEKPAVARDLARVLGADAREEGALRGRGYVVTWAIGHLVGLAEPHQIRLEWKRWHWDELPMFPRRWPLVVIERTRQQFEVVRRILTAPDIEQVICATDAGREGELIFRFVYEAAGCDRPVRRLWISSLTEQAIRDGFRRLRDWREFDPLADAARGRSRADWLVGMNLSRAYGLSLGTPLSVGRVQTPTLAMVVERELAIRRFVPEPYLEVVATFRPEGQPEAMAYQGTYLQPPQKGSSARDRRRLPADGPLASAIVERVKRGRARIASLKSEQRRLPPPALYDLTELQRHANRLFGFRAQHTLEVAQALYERHKLISYPRTDSRHLSAAVAETLPQVVEAIASRYPGKIAPGTGERPLSKKFVDDGRVGDHHAIVPTPASADGRSLSRDEERLYDLICRRLLSAWHSDFVWQATDLITEVQSEVVDAFQSLGTAIEERGWKVLDLGDAKPPRRFGGPGEPGAAAGTERDEEDAQQLPAGLFEGQGQEVLEARAIEKKTRPPARFTDATLLTAMETAGRALDERELSDAMKDSGLGTPATRAGIIETLLAREYLARRGKALEATEKGIQLVAVVDPVVKSPLMTGQWEARLKQIERGAGNLASFLQGIEAYVREVLGRVPVPGGGPGRSAGPYPGAPPGWSEPPVSAGRDFGARQPSAAPRAAEPRGARAPAQGSERRTAASVRREPGVERVPEVASFPRSAAEQSRSTDCVPAQGSLAFSASRLPGARASLVPASPARPGAAQLRSAALAVRPERVLAPVERNVADDVLHLETGPTSGTTLPRGGAPGRRRQLGELLRSAFGFDAFRPHQEAVCRAATEGQDLLLVMPTGAGKSLCYQLPGLARGGTTLVVSPLIALMDDQVAKLAARGLAAEPIHSGRRRGEARKVLDRYLAGELDFLFVAPERLGVPGFCEQLARRPPSLIAIDEAHCISQWGHDFRPEYRLLGQRLPSLRPAPIVALTATATPVVQRDIVQQLGLGPRARTFIHGFRRNNLAIEVLEVPPGERTALAHHLLKTEGRRPAILYAPTRKHAEAAAGELSRSFDAAAYHAGMPAADRERVQTAFLSGQLEVVVATVAFGMGVDKPDVRTVVHLALPASVEAYYQEIGRAGRDGLPSRAVLLHSFADRRTHEFFLERDYPEPEELQKVFRALASAPIERGALRARLGLSEQLFEKAIDKLWVHGGVTVEGDDSLTRGRPGWKEPYLAQREHRRAQLVEMARFAEGHECRMVHLVRHFGDGADRGERCGACDVCAPGGAAVARSSPPSAAERAELGAILRALAEVDHQPLGRLSRRVLGEGPEQRRRFDRLLGALVRAGLVRLTRDAFEKGGATVEFQRVSLTSAGRVGGALEAQVLLPEEVRAPIQKGMRRERVGAPKGKRPRAARPGRRARVEAGERRGRKPEAGVGSVESEPLVAALRAWRLAEARRRRVPAFRILTDRTLLELARARPRTEQALLAVHGIGPSLARTYGAALLSLCAQARGERA